MGRAKHLDIPQCWMFRDHTPRHTRNKNLVGKSRLHRWIHRRCSAPCLRGNGRRQTVWRRSQLGRLYAHNCFVGTAAVQTENVCLRESGAHARRARGGAASDWTCACATIASNFMAVVLSTSDQRLLRLTSNRPWSHAPGPPLPSPRPAAHCEESTTASAPCLSPLVRRDTLRRTDA